ncbi:putative zinc-binding protein [Methanobacterium aggregans]|uniref:putative zinc-binding protein n=1 Tax=Methanobacterium aggregans TaxID=1615586 RepID=UPI001AEAFFD8|nr:putative zinc-binding protein [Methanobacterium aggregans]MBP2046931.1 putative metal-binding protein [Methanobacterium aggregans]
MEKDKVALAACSGMSPYGLVSRVASTDTASETDNTISICMGATSADRQGFRELIRKYPILAINGCESNCVNKIMKQKGVEVAKTINVMEELEKTDYKPNDVSRLDDEGEICVEIIKEKVKEKLGEIHDKR